MKSQFRKGFRQNFRGSDYIMKVVKLDAATKIVIREELYVKKEISKKVTSQPAQPQ